MGGSLGAASGHKVGERLSKTAGPGETKIYFMFLDPTEEQCNWAMKRELKILDEAILEKRVACLLWTYREILILLI